MTPHQLILSIIEDYRSGNKTPEAFLDAVTEVEKFIHGFAAQLRALEPEVPNPDSESLKKLGEACFSKFEGSVAEMRRAVEMRDNAILDKALDLATQGDGLVNELLIRSAQ